jgi:ABC-type oligopeptide transport system substrate-binding subunit
MINARQLTRRETILLGAAALAPALPRNVEAARETERHGMSAFGDLKYPADFKHFDYVSPSIRSTFLSSRATAHREWSSHSQA